MNNNQDEMNRLINELLIQKNKDKKHILRIEIAKATDRTVKKALQDILEDIERKERRNMIFGIIAMIITGLLFFYFLGTKNENKDNFNVISVSSTSSEKTSESTEKGIKDPEIKEKNLTEDEVKRWVGAVWDKRHANIKPTYAYELKIRSDDNDNLVYISVVPPKGIELDTFGGFRINADGELEESGYFVEGADIGDWIVVSTEFMDVSQVSSIEPITTEESAVKVDLSSQEFAELYKEWSNSDFPIMSMSDYSEEYGHINEYDNSIWVITYNDSASDDVTFSERTPYRMPNFYYSYDKYERKAYMNRNNSSGEKEFLSELTDYINQKMNY